MASQEKRLEKRLKRDTEMRACICVKFPALHIAGFPDRFILVPGGHIFFVEVKDIGKQLDPLQLWWFKKLRKLGFTCFLLNSDEGINHVLYHIAYLIEKK